MYKKTLDNIPSLAFACFLSLIPFTMEAQVKVSDITRLSMEDYLTMDLPPLDTLIENAKRNPTVEYYNAITAQEERQLKTVKRNWLSYFKLNTNYQYGLMSDYGVYANPEEPIYSPYATKQQGRWNVGASFSMPLTEIFDRRNKIKKQEMSVKASELQVNRWHDDQSLKIIDAYTAAIQYLSILRTRAEALTIATAQYKISETDFINGKIDAQTLSRQKNIESSTVAEYEQTRASLNNALLKLELLSRTKIISK